MANYKDIISGAVNKVVGKVKDVADNVKEAAESGAVRDIYEQGTTRAKGYARIAKLNLEINGHNEELKRLYTEIGQQYYEQAKDAPEGLFVPMFAQAARLLESVHAKEVEIEMLKDSFNGGDADIDVEVVDDFDEVVDSCCGCSCEAECACDDTCCSAEDFVDSCCDKVEDVVEKIEDVVENICDKIEEKIDCCCDKIEEKIDSCCDKTED